MTSLLSQEQLALISSLLPEPLPASEEDETIVDILMHPALREAAMTEIVDIAMSLGQKAEPVPAGQLGA